MYGTAGSVPKPHIVTSSIFAHAVLQWQSLYNNVHCFNQLLHEILYHYQSPLTFLNAPTCTVTQLL